MHGCQAWPVVEREAKSACPPLDIRLDREKEGLPTIQLAQESSTMTLYTIISRLADSLPLVRCETW